MAWPKQDTSCTLPELTVLWKFISDQLPDRNLTVVHQSTGTSTREPPTAVQATKFLFLVTQLFPQELAVSQQLLSIILLNFSWQNFMTLASFQLPEKTVRFSTGPKTFLRKKRTWGREGKTHGSNIIRVVCSGARLPASSFHLCAYLLKALPLPPSSKVWSFLQGRRRKMRKSTSLKPRAFTWSLATSSHPCTPGGQISSVKW